MNIYKLPVTTTLKAISAMVIAALFLAGSSCSESQQDLAEQEESILKSYLEDQNISAEPTSTGLYYIPGRKGAGPEITSGDSVIMHFEERLLKNNKLLKSTLNDTAYTYIHGETDVIEGFKEGLGYMRGGASATLLVPSELAYGNVQNGPIPPYSTLLFEIYILKVFSQGAQ